MKGVNNGASAQQKQFRQIEDSFFYDDSVGGGSINNSASDFWLRQPDKERPDEDQIIFQGRLWQKAGKFKKWTPFHFELYSDKLIRMDLSNRKQESKKEQQKSSENVPHIHKDSLTNTQKNAISTESKDLEETKKGNIIAGAQENQKASTNISGTNANINGSNDTQNIVNSNIPLLTQQVSSNSRNSNPDLTEDVCIVEYVPINQCFLKKIKYSDNAYSNYKYGIRLQRGEQKSEIFTEDSDAFNKWHDEIKRFCILPKFPKKYKTLSKLKNPEFLSNSTVIYKCYKFSDSIQYCTRIIDKHSLSESSKQNLLKEISILRRIDSPFLCKLYEVYEDEKSIYIVTELFQGKDMKQKLQDCLIMNEKTVSEIMWRLLQGVNHMHQKGIIHRDIRLENIQLRCSTNLTDICLTNFFIADFLSSKSRQSSKKCGAAGFIAPEIFKSKNYDQKVDIFSLGIIFYILIFGKLPFNSQIPEQILTLNEQCSIDFNQVDCAVKCSSSAIELLKVMLAKDPSQRPNAFQLINHTWFINMKNRGDDGRLKNNLYELPSLSTIISRDSEMVEAESKVDLFNTRREYPTNICEENNNELDSLNSKMSNLNSLIFSKVPSKPRHDIAIQKPQVEG